MQKYKIYRDGIIWYSGSLLICYWSKFWDWIFIKKIFKKTTACLIRHLSPNAQVSFALNAINGETITPATAAWGRLEEKSRYRIDVSIDRYSKLTKYQTLIIEEKKKFIIESGFGRRNHVDFRKHQNLLQNYWLTIFSCSQRMEALSPHSDKYFPNANWRWTWRRRMTGMWLNVFFFIYFLSFSLSCYLPTMSITVLFLFIIIYLLFCMFTVAWLLIDSLKL